MSDILPETFVEGFHDEDKVREMVYNDFGSTGLKVSKLSFGAGVFCDAYNEVDLETFRETLVYALKNGINYIDTAPFYGNGQSEEILGQILEGVPRQAYYIATKVGRYGKDVKTQFDFSAKRTKESIDESLKRLKLDYVDVLQVHDIEFAPSLDTVLNETLPAVQEIVQSGKAKFIGITGYPVSTLAECVKQSKVKIDVVLSYARLTLLDDSLKEYIPVFKEHKVAIVNAAANALGLLTNVGERPWHVAPKPVKDLCTSARYICKENDVELGKVAVWHSLQQNGPDTTLVGMDSIEVVDSNLENIQIGLSFKENLMYEDIVRVFKKLPEKHWEGVEVTKYWEIVKLS